MKGWLKCIPLRRGKRVDHLTEDSSEVKDVAEVPQQCLSLFSFEHPERDAPSDRMYCGRLFAWIDGGDGEMVRVPITIRFDGSDEDLTNQMIRRIVELDLQYGYTINIVLDALREPIPEIFLHVFKDHSL